MKRSAEFVAPIVVALTAFSASIQAQTVLGTAFTYQGQLKNNGSLVTSAALPMSFKLFDAATVGSQIGATINTNVNIVGGLFTVTLDFGAGPYGAGQARWLEVAVNGTTLTSRQPLTPAPFARFAAASPGSGLWQNSGSDISSTNSGNVGVGTASPHYQLSLGGNNGVSKLAIWEGGSPLSDMGLGVFGGQFRIHVADSTNRFSFLDAPGGNEIVTVKGTGAVGIGTISPAASLQVNGGVLARGGPPGSFGINNNGFAFSGSGGDSDSGMFSSADGQVEFHTNANERMRIDGTGNVGIGTTTPSQRLTVGGRITASTATGDCVYGQTGDGSAGVHGFSSGTDGIGVLGECNSGGNAFGIWGKSTSGYAAWFDGATHVQGTLSKSGGAFKIDHPLDPANKYLWHSFVESPDMMNVYNGNVTTDAGGIASVDLPAYFESLNRDFRYQLTVIGRFAQAIVADEIAGNRFTIRTDKPNVKVSWQVTGIRKDAWAEAHRIQVEQDKSELDRGRYLSPELYGQPANLAIGKPATAQPPSPATK